MRSSCIREKKYTFETMGSGMEPPRASTAEKAEVVIKDVKLEMDPDDKVSSIKVSDGSWL